MCVTSMPVIVTRVTYRMWIELKNWINIKKVYGIKGEWIFLYVDCRLRGVFLKIFDDKCCFYLTLNEISIIKGYDEWNESFVLHGCLIKINRNFIEIDWAFDLIQNEMLSFVFQNFLKSRNFTKWDRNIFFVWTQLKICYLEIKNVSNFHATVHRNSPRIFHCLVPIQLRT